MWRALPVLACLALAACNNYVMMYDPLTKQTAECKVTASDILIVGNILETNDNCVKAYESLGFVANPSVIRR